MKGRPSSAPPSSSVERISAAFFTSTTSPWRSPASGISAPHGSSALVAGCNLLPEGDGRATYLAGVDHLGVPPRIAVNLVRRPSPWSLAALLALSLACVPEQRFADLGDFTLENGEIIRACRVGYRTSGELDAARSNAVLLTPWMMGTSREVLRQVTSGTLLDPSGIYAIAVDAFGNGVSSSPSNGEGQRGSAFPRFSMRDVVEGQYQLLTRVLGVSHLKAVIGTSAGGMQAFQWATSHPQFLDSAIAIAGSPRSSLADPAMVRVDGRGPARPGLEAGRAVVAARRAARRLPAADHRSGRLRQASRSDGRARRVRTLRRVDAAGRGRGPREAARRRPGTGRCGRSRAGARVRPAGARRGARAGRALRPPRAGLREGRRPGRRRPLPPQRAGRGAEVRDARLRRDGGLLPGRRALHWMWGSQGEGRSRPR